MDRQAILDLVGDGKIFTAVFTKKDGSERVMNCRTNVSKYVKGVGLAFNPKEKDLLSVYDLQAKGYRFIPTDERLLELHFDGIKLDLRGK